MTVIDDLFTIQNARSRAFEDHEKGEVPFVTNGFSNNGIIGFVEPLEGERVFDFQGIALSAFCEATVQTPPFLPRGNGGSGLAVLKPKEPMSLNELLFYASYLNSSERWRFSFGRMVMKERIRKLPLASYRQLFRDVNVSSLLEEGKPTPKTVTLGRVALFPISDLFTVCSGDYHNASSLPEGKIPLVSCGDIGNGIMRHVTVPDNRVYRGMMTVAYNGQPLTTKYHPYKFATKDDVAVLIPKRPFKLSTTIFLQNMFNKEQWRYSYGRKCYHEKLERFRLQLPVKPNGEIDEDIIEKMISNTTYWGHFKTRVETLLREDSSTDLLQGEDHG